MHKRLTDFRIKAGEKISLSLSSDTPCLGCVPMTRTRMSNPYFIRSQMSSFLFPMGYRITRSSPSNK